MKIEHDYVVGSAKLAKEAGTEHFHLVSSGGVDEHSWFLYQSTKVNATHRTEHYETPRRAFQKLSRLCLF